MYACLVCGKYFQGRGRSSYAYTHSLDQDHHVFINIASLNVYVLPESYEVKNKTLDDIKYVVNPTYTKEDVRKLDKEEVEKTDLLKKKYIPGELIPTLISVTMRATMNGKSADEACAEVRICGVE